MTIEIKLSDIPVYLHNGAFYRTLDTDDPEGTIEIPGVCFKHDETVASLDEFRQLLKVMVFWMLDEIPVSILDFCEVQDFEVWTSGTDDLPDVLDFEIRPLLATAYSAPGGIPFWEVVYTGRWELIKHAARRIDRSNGGPVLVAAHLGHIKLLQYLREDGYAWHKDTCRAASAQGHLDCLQYAYENGCTWDSRVHSYAAAGGHLTCMQYAFSHGLEWHGEVCQNAALNGHLHCLQYAHENNCPWDASTTAGAAHGGHADCLLYALQHGCRVDETACAVACTRGQLSSLQLLHQFIAPWDESTAYHAAECPEVACLQYLHENGCPWDERTPQVAIQKKHLVPLRYALEHGCPYYSDTVGEAAQHNNLVCLQYLIDEQLLSMDETTFKIAMLRGDLCSVIYLIDQGCPYLSVQFHADDDEELMMLYFRNDAPEFMQCVKYAVERGWEPNERSVGFMLFRDPSSRAWLEQEGFRKEE